MIKRIVVPDGSFVSGIVMKTENNNFYNLMYIFQQLFFIKTVSRFIEVDFTVTF